MRQKWSQFSGGGLEHALEGALLHAVLSGFHPSPLPPIHFSKWNPVMDTSDTMDSTLDTSSTMDSSPGFTFSLHNFTLVNSNQEEKQEGLVMGAVNSSSQCFCGIIYL